MSDNKEPDVSEVNLNPLRSLLYSDEAVRQLAAANDEDVRANAALTRALAVLSEGSWVPQPEQPGDAGNEAFTSLIDAPISTQWNNETAAAREEYVFVRHTAHGLPPHLAYNALPSSQKTSLFFVFDVFRILAAEKAYGAKIKPRYNNADGEDLSKIWETFNSEIEGPTIGGEKQWWSDESFGEQRLHSVNSTKLQKLPTNFADPTALAAHGFGADFLKVAEAALAESVHLANAKKPTAAAPPTATYKTLEAYKDSLYFVRYDELHAAMNSPQWPKSDNKSEKRFQPTPTCLLLACNIKLPGAKAGTKPVQGLIPFAIQLYQQPQPNVLNYVTPNSELKAQPDVDWAWRFAKTCVQCADFVYHQVGAHLAHTHLVEEIFIGASYRHFSLAHPVMQLLRSHFKTTLPLNHGARTKLLPQYIAKLTGLSFAQSARLTGHLFSEYRFEDRYLPTFLVRRGLITAAEAKDEESIIAALASKGLQRYYYGTIGVRIWFAIRDYVLTVLKFAYGGSERKDEQEKNYKRDIPLDPWLKAWVQEIRGTATADLTPTAPAAATDAKDTKSGGGSAGTPATAAASASPSSGEYSDRVGALINGFPQRIETIETLTEVLTMIIFNATLNHSTVNYQQHYFEGFAPNAPPALSKQPTKKEEIDAVFLAKALPTIDLEVLAAKTTWLLSKPPSSGKTLSAEFTSSVLKGGTHAKNDTQYVKEMDVANGRLAEEFKKIAKLVTDVAKTFPSVERAKVFCLAYSPAQSANGIII